MSSVVANPLATAIQSRLAQLQGGASPSSPGPQSAGGQGSEDDLGAQLASQSAELHGADPGMMLQQLKKIRQVLGVSFIQTFQALPNVAGHISKTMATLDRAIKEAENATQTASAVRPPIDFTLAQSGAGMPPQSSPMS